MKTKTQRYNAARARETAARKLDEARKRILASRQALPAWTRKPQGTGLDLLRQAFGLDEITSRSAGSAPKLPALSAQELLAIGDQPNMLHGRKLTLHL